MEISLNQDDLENMAMLYDQIRDLYSQTSSDQDEQLQADFDSSVRAVMSQMADELANEQNIVKMSEKHLFTKFQLYQICVDKINNFLALVHPQAAEIFKVINKQHQSIIQGYNYLINQAQLINEQNLQQLVDQIQHLQQELEKKSETKQPNASKILLLEIESLKLENQQLKSENESYLEKIIKHSKLISAPGYQQINQNIQSHKAFNENSSKININKNANSNNNVQTSNLKMLTLKQIKDLITEIYESKKKFDFKMQEAHLPRETMEQHLSTFLNQKYGLKQLVIEWITCILQAIKAYQAVDNDVAIFGKILRNECDEEFRFVQQQVKQTITELLRMHLKSKYPLKNNNEVNIMLNNKINGYLTEEEANDIIKYMYNQEDATMLIEHLQQSLTRPSVSQPNKKLSREQQYQLMAENEKLRAEFNIFQKLLLDFQLSSHEKYLSGFINLFKEVNPEGTGIINEQQFIELINLMGVDQSQVGRYLQILDPYQNEKITFSQCVTLFSSESVQTQDGQISILQLVSQ